MENGLTCDGTLEVVEGSVTLVSPFHFVRGRGLHEVSEHGCYVSEVVVDGSVQERSAPSCGWHRTRVDGIHLPHTRLDDPLSNNMAQVFHLVACKCTLAWIDGQASLLDEMEDSSEVSNMFCPGLTEDDDIIQLSSCKLWHISQHLVHQLLESSWCPLETKWHHLELELAIGC